MPATLQGATASYAVAVGSVYGAGDRPTARDGVHEQGTAGPLSTVGSHSRKQEASGAQEQQAETAWSLLGKMYSSQVLAYMVAITDAQALVKRMRAMRPGPSLLLPGEVQCMEVWQVLQGIVQQQRVWTFGMQAPAALPAPADTTEDEQDPTGFVRQPSQLQLNYSGPYPQPTAAAQVPVPDIQSVVEPCISSKEPQSIKDGVRFTSCAAGHQHSAAVAEGGYVFTWGSNDQGQLGCDTSAQQPVAIHVLSSPQLDAGLNLSTSSCGTAGSSCSGAADARACTTGAAGGEATSSLSGSRAMLHKLDSVKQLSSTVRLPPSLMATLQQQRKRERDAEAEQQEQQQLLLQELLQHPELGQQQQLTGKLPAPQPSTAQAAAHMAVLSGISSGMRQQQLQESRPQALAVYQLDLGQAVRSVACGAHHTLAALASSGLMGWGSNDKGQLGVPAGLYKQVHSPMRVHGFDGQRLVCISAGAKHSAAVQEGGVVVTWGHGRYGRLGVGGTPDILPPSVVSGLRGCYVTQVACGTAHTLAVTTDGRVYACGYNGQGALGTGDEQDRLYPVLVPGLPNCIQVAAAASSMALSTDSQVFMWGGAAGRRLQSAKPAGRFAPAGSTSSSSGKGGRDSAAAASGVQPGQKECVPWLAGLKAVHITCGVDTAAAVSSTGEVLLWGNKQCLPASMMGQAQTLAGSMQQGTASDPVVTEGQGKLNQQQQQQQEAVGDLSAQAAALEQQVPDPLSKATEAQGDRANPDAAVVLAVHVELLVQPSGRVKLLVNHRPQQTSCSSHRTVQQGRPTKTPPASTQQGPEWQQQQQQQGSSQQFNPQEEPVTDLACGASHHVVLCQASQHIPSHDELRAAILAVLHAYISSFNSTNTSSLNMLMQQQQMQHQLEANWAGSVARGPARSVKSTRQQGCAASVASFAGSTSKAAAAAAAAALAHGNSSAGQLAAASNSGALPGAGEDDSSSSRPSNGTQRPSSIVRGSGGRPTVSFTGAVGSPGPGEDDTAGAAADSISVMDASSPGSKGALLSKADRMAGYAASVAAGSEVRGRGAASVVGSQLAGSGGSGRPGSGSIGPASDCLSLHGALVLCKEICLLDNITEHLDVTQAFQLMLHRKRGRLGPVHTPKPPAGPATSPSCSQQPGASSSPVSSCLITATGGAAGSTRADPNALPGAVGVNSVLNSERNSPEPDVLRVMHVLRPNEPAVLAAPAGYSMNGCADSAGSRPGSPAPQQLQSKDGKMSSRPDSSSMYGKRAAGRAAAAASGMDSISSLDAEEMLEMLLLLMKERHPGYRRQSTVLLQMLAGWHFTRLKGRRSDQGPPWLLRQALQPEILSAIESPSTTELLHGIYVHLAGSSANTQDLSMHLSDLRLGLKFAAGFRTAQDLHQQQHSHHKRQPGGRSSLQRDSSSGNSPGRQFGSSMQPHGYHSSTESSRGHMPEGVPYSISMQSCHSSHFSSASSMSRGQHTTSGNSCSVTSFQLPLYKVAAFIRTAKLLPRLLDKYLSQLQLQGQEHHGTSGSHRAQALPVMPCLQIYLQQPLAFAAGSLTGQRRRFPSPDPAQQQAGLQGQASRLAPLKEVSSAASVGVSASGEQQAFGHLQHQTSPGHDSYDRYNSFFEPLPSQCFDRNVSTSRRLSATGTWTTWGNTEQGGRTAGEQQQGGLKNKGAGRPAAVQTLDASMIDASTLSSCEVIPMRSKTACIQLLSTTPAQAAAGRARAAGSNSGTGGANKVLLQLPPAGFTPVMDAVGAGGGRGGSKSGSSSGHVSQYGGAAWNELVENQQAEGLQLKAAARKVDNTRSTYQQQQAVLQQQRQAEATSAMLAEAQEEACQDAWIACMLVELLGSSLITPPSTAAVKIPAPVADQASNSPGPSAGADTTTGPETKAQQGCEPAGGTSGSAAQATWCMWNRGYCFADATACSVHSPPPASSFNSSSSGPGCTGCSSAGVLDLLNACISYPQFVEVLLCLMAARSVSILEPDVKQIRSLSFDEEMQDHARVVMERIVKWRATQLTPWKQQKQQQPQGQKAHQHSSAAAAENPGKQKAAAAAAPAVEGQQVVCRIYSAYSSIKLGSSVLGLHRDGYVQLLRDAGMVDADDSELSLRDAVSIFDKVATAVPPAKAPSSHTCPKSATAAAAPDATSTDSSGSRPTGFGPGQHQSTFMRCVTQQLLQRLEAGAPSKDSAAGAASLLACTGVTSSQTDKRRPVPAAGGARMQDRPQGLNEEERPVDDIASAEEYGSQISAESSRPRTSTTAGSSTTATATTTSDISTPQTARTAYTTAVAAAAQAAAGTGIPPSDKGKGGMLTLSQFLQVMVQLSRRCFPRIANGSRAWKLLLEHHVQPLADKKRSRYDCMAASLSTPAVVALLSAWEPQLQQLHRRAAATHDSSSPCKASSQQQRVQQQSQRQQDADRQASRQQKWQQEDQQAAALSLPGFLEVLQEKGVIPQLLEPCDVHEVLRQLLVTQQQQQQQQDVMFSSLDCSQFSHALSMCGLAAFASHRLQAQHGSSLQAPEQQLAAFLTFMGLNALPGQQLPSQSALGVGNAPGAASGSVAGGKKGHQGRHTSSAQQLRQQLSNDPYIEWWSLQFDPAAESRAHDHLSSLNYLPVMLQEVVQPPACCPADVLPLLSAAQIAQQAREVDDALHVLEVAEQAWRSHLHQQMDQQAPVSQALGQQELELPPLGVLYLAVSAAGCLLSSGRDDDAVSVLEGCAWLLEELHEAGADAAVWHAAAGVAKYHCDDLRGAFEHCVRAYVIRSECGSLGSRHPDTAAAGHNLGVVLDCLGKCSRGLQLVQEARQLFATTLGPQHIRTLVAARNEQHIKHKIVKLPAQPQELLASDAAAGATANSASASTLTNRQTVSNTSGLFNEPGARTSTGSTGSSSAKGRQSSAAESGRQRGRAGRSSRGIGSDSGRWDGSSSGSNEDDQQQQAGPGRKLRQTGSEKLGRDGKRGQGSQASAKGGRSLRHKGSMQERLTAVMQARHVSEEAAAGQQQQQQKEEVVDTRDYTDPDHLGAGVFRATADEQQLYKAFMADIKAHAQGASCGSYNQQPGLVEVQVLRPKPPPIGAAGARSPNTSSGGGVEDGFGGASVYSVGEERTWSSRAAAATAGAAGQVSGSGSGSSSTGAAATPSAAAGSRVMQQQGGNNPQRTSASYSVSAAKQQGMSSGVSVVGAGTTAAAVQVPTSPAQQEPQAMPGAVRELHRGLVADATIAAIKKPLSVEQARRLRRQQQQELLAAKRGKGRVGGPDLLDKLY